MILKIRFLSIIFITLCSIAQARVIDCLQSDNQAKCLNNSLSLARKSEQVSIKQGKYNLTDSINIPSNIIFDGNQSVFVFHLSTNKAPGFDIKSANNLTIKNISLIGNGYYSESPILFESKSYCGFSNSNIGIQVIGSNQVTINNVSITGFSHGIIVGGLNKDQLAQNIVISRNNIYNVGQAAIRVVFVANSQIIGNTIKDVQGNQVLCSNGLKNSKFADGVYLESVKSITIARNNISNVKRIGIAIDSSYDESRQPVFINHDLEIKNNTIKNVNSCRGTENNAGIWVEPIRAPRVSNINITAKISGNTIDNYKALPCANSQYGILSGADNAFISGNNVSNFTNNGKRSIGIRCAYGHCDIVNNSIYNTNVGMLFNDNEKHLTYTLNNNAIRANLTNYVNMK